MLKEANYGEVLNMKNYIMIDLRTPAEYFGSTIPEAVNLPILTNEEREIIGKTYKQNIDEAKALAIEFVGPRLHIIYKKLRKLSSGKLIVVFCARGGLRSRVLAYTMAAMGLPIIKLDLGYKGYRNYVLGHIEEILDKVTFVTLFGKTGSGKTEIIKSLKSLGADTLDLEGCANHRGSIMGSIGLEKCNSQKQFENNVFDSLIKRKSDLVFTEGESKRIGGIVMGNKLFEKTRAGINVGIESPIGFRVLNIKNDYLKAENLDGEILAALSKLEKYIPKKNISGYKESILKKDYDEVIERLMLEYYDLNYKSINNNFENKYYNINNLETAKKLIGDFIR
ncbi:MAG: tRNA 2-selenouridine(34) synthase MnmH [Clostridiales bacterium]|jgi:tRNA 2-selenouridine synthase|nr:tRNA 2-selenouridine(34) synthase MnmH [Clostridiales bacterium]